MLLRGARSAGPRWVSARGRGGAGGRVSAQSRGGAGKTLPPLSFWKLRVPPAGSVSVRSAPGGSGVCAVPRCTASGRPSPCDWPGGGPGGVCVP